MTDWFGDHRWAIWLIIALVLASAEMLTLDLTLLMLATGALAAAGVALVAPGAIVAQVLVGVVVAALMLFLLRPTLLARVRNAPGYRNSIQQLVGSIATATTEITADSGEVKVNGDVWQARAFDPTMKMLAGHKVEVYQVDGTTLIVYPSQQSLPYRQGPQTRG